jgi:iron complex transport system substrate-binding protein
MPGGDSYVATLIADAGGDFLWSDEPGTSLALDFEVVLERAQSADVWVNANQFWGTAEDALATDERFAEFDAFAEGRIWNNNLQQNENGGNAYFEAGVANPHLLLADLIAIFHPEILPEHEFEFYQPLEFADSDS